MGIEQFICMNGDSYQKLFVLETIKKRSIQRNFDLGLKTENIGF